MTDLQNDSTAKDLLHYKTVEEFRIHMIDSNPSIANVTSRSLLFFVSTYICKSGVSTMLFIKTTHINRLELERMIIRHVLL